MKNVRYSIYVLAFVYHLFLISCEDFVDIEVPNHKIASESVFLDNETAISAVKGIYNELFNAHYSGGWLNSVTVLGGMSSDILSPISKSSPYHDTFQPFQQNEISAGDSPDASANFNVWSSAYNIIYMTNSVLEGIENSANIAEAVKNKLIGQTLFIRAFTYFYLTNLYGDVPLIMSTDYRINALESRSSSVEVWKQITTDLDKAIYLLEEEVEYYNGERTNVNYYVALALRARVYLYQKDWKKAEELSGRVINQPGLYEILEDLDGVFLANSKEAIWQISPAGSNGGLSQTNEGSVFIIHPVLPFISALKLTDNLITSMTPEDKRLVSWVGFHEGIESYYPYKYKDRYSLNNITEYSMVLRLAEQYLIRSEARAMQGKLPGAIADLDVILARAGLDRIADTNPEIGKDALLEEIMEERKKELFSEWGHRWLDLKRKGMATEVLALIKPLWHETDTFYPIPEEERMKNPNLTQNTGY